jgi:integrase
MTFETVIRLYQAHCLAENIHGQQARENREETFRRFLAWTPDPTLPPMGDWRVADAKKHILRDFISAHPGWKSSSTRKAKANQINAALNWAKKEERIDRNPFEGVTYSEAPPRPPLEDVCLDKILCSANKRFERFCLFLRLTGLRLSSAAAVEWDHVFWDLRGIVLPADLHKSGKRSGKPLTVALVDEAVELLKKVKAEDYHEGVIFRNNRGQPWTRGTLGNQLRRMKRRLKIDCKASLHGIRHLVGSEAVRGHAPIKSVSKALGHGSSAITERFYVHVDGDLDLMREALEASLEKRRKKG